MSKKKAFSGSSMTLKDFHGGSIPSELPLPSAPGVSVRAPDRAGQDRTVASVWGTAARMDSQRLPRPLSAGARGFDEGSPVLPVITRIGCNFEEDERKPFDGSSAPRHAADPKPTASLRPPLLMKPLGRPGSSPGNFSGEHGFPSVASSPVGHVPAGAWGVRKEAEGEIQVQQAGAVTASRFAQASAMEKISSGRWQSKPVVEFVRQGDAEVINFAEVESGGVGFRSSGVGDEVGESSSRAMDGRVKYGALKSMGAGEVERSVEPELQYSGNPLALSERKYGGLPLRGNEGGVDEVQPLRQESKFVGQHVQHLDVRLGELHVRQRGLPDEPNVPQMGEFFGSTQSSRQVGRSRVVDSDQDVRDAIERPKLKLLPRTKPLETPSMLGSHSKQELSPPSLDHGVLEGTNDVPFDAWPAKSEIAGADSAYHVSERPRLNLKPRSQPTGQPVEGTERERKSVFGGARPRELVLKERGIEIDPNSSHPSLEDNRNKRELPKAADVKRDLAASSVHHSERMESYTVEPLAGNDHERKVPKGETVKSDAHQGNRGNNNRRNSRDHEKPPDRRPEPESWRKPVDEPKPEIPGSRFGKGASALDLAEAFSRSASAPETTRSDSRLNQKPMPGRSQAPFSRLADSREIYSGIGPRKINGY